MTAKEHMLGAAISVLLYALPGPVAAEQRSASTAQGSQKTQSVVTVGDLSVDGDVDEATARAKVEQRLKSLRACYDKALKSRPLLRGAMSLRVLVGPKGKVVSSTIEESSVNDETVERCVRNDAMAIRLPAPAKAGHRTIRYELVFSPGVSGAACSALSRCCGSAEVRAEKIFETACQVVDQVRNLPDGDEACESMLGGIRTYFQASNGAVPSDCQ